MRIHCFLIILALYTSRASSQEVTEELLKQEAALINASSKRLLQYDEEVETSLLGLYEEENHVAAYMLATMYMEQEQWKKAENMFRNAARRDADNGWYQEGLVEALEKQEKIDEAINCLVQLIENKSDNTQYLEHLFSLQSMKGYYQEALNTLDIISIRNGDNRSVRLRRMAIYKETGRVDSALEEARSYLLDNPRDIQFLSLYAELLYQNDRKDESKEVYARLLEEEPGNTDAAVRMAELNAYDDGRSTGIEALMVLIQDMSIVPKDKVERVLPLLTQYIDNPSEALANDLEALSTELVSLHEESDVALALHADVLNAIGKEVEATSFYIRAADLGTTNFLVWEQLLENLRSTNRNNEWELYSEKALVYFPNSIWLNMSYAEALIANGKSDEAKNWLEDILMMVPDGTDEMVRIRNLLNSIQ